MMVAPIHFSGVRMREIRSREGYTKYSVEFSPFISSGIHYEGLVNASDTAKKLDDLANWWGHLPDGEYLFNLQGLLYGDDKEALVGSSQSRYIAQFFNRSPFQAENRDELLATLQQALTSHEESKAFSEKDRQLFWRLLVSLLVQESPMPERGKAKLLAAIQTGGDSVPGTGEVTGEILWGGELGFTEEVLVGGSRISCKLGYRPGHQTGGGLTFWA